MADDQQERQIELKLDTKFDYHEFLDQNLITDCVLVIDGQEIHAHRVILANSSSYFNNIFTSGMTEDITKKVEIIKNPENVFSLVLRWMYTGNLQFPKEKIHAIIEVAKIYGVNALLDLLENYLSKLFEAPLESITDFINATYDKRYPDGTKYENTLFIVAKHLAHYLPSCAESDEQLNIISNLVDCKAWGIALSHYTADSEPKKDLEKKIDLTLKFLNSTNDYKLTEQDVNNLKIGFEGLPNNTKLEKFYNELYNKCQ